jgi:hypothetical protein
MSIRSVVNSATDPAIPIRLSAAVAWLKGSRP